MIIGKNIKRRREELGISADQLAKLCGKSRATIFRYENGDIENLPISVLKPIADALRTTPAYLMGWEDDEQALDNAIINMFDSLTEDEIAKVTIFIQGLIANRK